MISDREQTRTIRPNSEQQRSFLVSSSFETLYGGAAGGGKSWALIIAALLGANDPRYHAVLFRRTIPQLNGADGLIHISRDIYPWVAGASYKETDHVWTFTGGATVRFAHMANRNDFTNYQGHQFAFVGFDELAQFEEMQYRYLFSRVGRTPGLRSRVCCTSNPGADWVFRRWAAWLDPKHPNPAQPGEIKWYREAEDGERDADASDPLAWSRTYIPA